MSEDIVYEGLQLRLRSCSKADEAFVYELMRNNMEHHFNRNLKEGWSRARFRQGFRPERLIIIEHEDMPVGFVDYELNQDGCYWHNIQLSSDYQQGLGAKVYHFIENDARNKGARKIWGKVFMDNFRVINWAIRLGFKIIGEVEDENSYYVWKGLEDQVGG